MAATYYIDYVSGSDNNNGTSKSTPWQHAPGMVGCTLNCSSESPQPGDSFILKGGVTWPNGTMEWDWQWSGNSGQQIYIGVDQTWYSGASWSRPVLSGGGAVVTGGLYGARNMFINLASNYTTVDNLEFTGMYWNSSYVSYGQSIYLNLGGTYDYITNDYFHGWSHASIASGASDSAHCIQGDTHTPSGDIGSYVANSVFDGSDTDQSSMAAGYGGPPAWYQNYIGNMSNGIIGTFSLFHDNLVEYINQSYDISQHENGIESNTDNPYGSWNPAFSSSNIGLLIYNNVIRHTAAGVVNIWFGAFSNNTSYVFNNVVYDDPTNHIDVAYCLPQGSCTSGNAVVVNNTVECGPDSNPTDSCSGAGSPVLAATFQNSHWITSNATAVNQTPSTTYTIANTVLQSKSTASGQGYSSAQTYAFSPSAPYPANSTPGQGANLTSTCNSVAILAPLCLDTAYGVVYNSSAHTVSSPGRVSVARPSSGAWDIGAYQYVAPPSSVNANVGGGGVSGSGVIH